MITHAWNKLAFIFSLRLEIKKSTHASLKKSKMKKAQQTILKNFNESHNL